MWGVLVFVCSQKIYWKWDSQKKKDTLSDFTRHREHREHREKKVWPYCVISYCFGNIVNRMCIFKIVTCTVELSHVSTLPTSTQLATQTVVSSLVAWSIQVQSNAFSLSARLCCMSRNMYSVGCWSVYLNDIWLNWSDLSVYRSDTDRYHNILWFLAPGWPLFHDMHCPHPVSVFPLPQ